MADRSHRKNPFQGERKDHGPDVNRVIEAPNVNCKKRETCGID